MNMHTFIFHSNQPYYEKETIPRKVEKTYTPARTKDSERF